MRCLQSFQVCNRTTRLGKSTSYKLPYPSLIPAATSKSSECSLVIRPWYQGSSTNWCPEKGIVSMRKVCIIPFLIRLGKAILGEIDISSRSERTLSTFPRVTQFARARRSDSLAPDLMARLNRHWYSPNLPVLISYASITVRNTNCCNDRTCLLTDLWMKTTDVF